MVKTQKETSRLIFILNRFEVVQNVTTALQIIYILFQLLVVLTKTVAFESFHPALVKNQANKIKK